MGKHTVQLVPHGLSSQDRRFARSLCLGVSKLDLKKAFDHVQHSFATTALQQKGVSEQLLSVLKWWTQSDVEVSLAGITSDKRISFHRGLNLRGGFGSCLGEL